MKMLVDEKQFKIDEVEVLAEWERLDEIFEKIGLNHTLNCENGYLMCDDCSKQKECYGDEE
jgi:hypothetical protein